MGEGVMLYQVKHGFLGQEYFQQYKEIRKKYKPFFDLSSRINDLSHSLFYAMDGKVPTGDLQKVLLSTLYVKSMTSFQGITILSSKGMHKETNIILRTFFELFFWIKAIAKNDNFYKKYVLFGELNRIKFAKDLHKYRSSWHEVFGGVEKIQERIEIYEKEYERLLKDYNLSRNDIEQLQHPYKVAELGNIPETYMVIYSFLSNDVHSNSLCLDDYFTVDDYKNIKTIDYGPRKFGTERSLSASMYIQAQICDTIINTFELTQYEPEIKEIHDKLIEYGPEFK